MIHENNGISNEETKHKRTEMKTYYAEELKTVLKVKMEKKEDTEKS